MGPKLNAVAVLEAIFTYLMRKRALCCKVNFTARRPAPRSFRNCGQYTDFRCSLLRVELIFHKSLFSPLLFYIHQWRIWIFDFYLPSISAWVILVTICVFFYISFLLLYFVSGDSLLFVVLRIFIGRSFRKRGSFNYHF